MAASGPASTMAPTMRLGFLIVLLAGAVFYSYVAFADLGFMTRTGRLGPGFFPRLIGVASLVVTLWAVVDELRQRGHDGGDAQKWADVAVLMALSIGYAVLLRLFGGFVATVIYLAVTLSVLNRGHTLKNAMIAILVPTGIYLLFDRILNANMPPAIFDLPI